MNQEQAQKQAHEINAVLEGHLPHLIAGLRYTAHEWYIVIRKKLPADDANQLKMFEGSIKV